LYQQRAGWFAHPRFSPSGNAIAFENHPVVDNDEGGVELVDLSGKRTVLLEGLSLEGLAWSPDGRELWFAGTKIGGWADTLYAIKPSGKARVVLTSPSIHLHDISKDGLVLLSTEEWRQQVRGFFPGDKAEHFYSWLDDTAPTGISTDGRVIPFVRVGRFIPWKMTTWYMSPDKRLTRSSPRHGICDNFSDGKWCVLGSVQHKGATAASAIRPWATKRLANAGAGCV
jgi:hypothetical protein